eukprot:m.111464 g.111464  ORF g.111464 m.111464 type:complete len:498 (-) comp28123_c1_seq2:78-1571(-)
MTEQAGLERDAFIEATQLWKEQKFVEAEAVCRAALIVDNSNVLLLMRLGSVLDDRDQNDEADRTYRFALTIDPKHSGTLCNLGCLLMEKFGNEVEAKALYLRALEAEPSHVNALYNLANLLYYSQDRIEEAETLYKRVLALCPTDVDTLNALGGILVNTGKVDEAKALFTQAIEIDPEGTHAMCGLARILENENLGAAINKYQEVLTIAPSDIGALVGLGDVYFYKLGSMDAAEAYYRLAVTADPKHLQVRLVLGQLLACNSDVDGAEAEYRTAMEMSPKDPEPVRMLAHLLTDKLDKHEEAEVLLRGLLCKNEYDGMALELLGFTFENRKRFCEAAHLYERWALVSKNCDGHHPGESYARVANAAMVHHKFQFTGGRVQSALSILGRYREKRKDYAGAADAFLRCMLIAPSTSDESQLSARCYMRCVTATRSTYWSIKGHQLHHPSIRRSVNVVLLVAQRLAASDEATLFREMWFAILKCLRVIDYIHFGHGPCSH